MSQMGMGWIGRRLAGFLLCAVAALGLARAVRASAAFALYHQAKYGMDGIEARYILTRAERAYRLYPYNYFFSILAGESAYYTGLGAAEPERSQWMAEAGHWAGLGMRQNPYRSALRLLETRLLERQSPALAAAFWAAYVDWDFWEPYNHAVLVELYAKAGELEKAAASLKWVQGSSHYHGASRHFQEAWRNAMLPPGGNRNLP